MGGELDASVHAGGSFNPSLGVLEKWALNIGASYGAGGVTSVDLLIPMKSLEERDETVWPIFNLGGGLGGGAEAHTTMTYGFTVKRITAEEILENLF